MDGTDLLLSLEAHAPCWSGTIFETGRFSYRDGIFSALSCAGHDFDRAWRLRVEVIHACSFETIISLTAPFGLIGSGSRLAAAGPLPGDARLKLTCIRQLPDHLAERCRVVTTRLSSPKS